MNKSLRGLRTEEFPNLANFIQSMKSLSADLTNVNGHGHIIGLQCVHNTDCELVQRSFMIEPCCV